MTNQNYVYGLHATLALLESAPFRILRLYVLENRDQKIKPLLLRAKEKGVAIEYTTRQQLDQLVQGNHQGIIAVCENIKTHTEADLKNLIEQSNKTPLVLVLDSVQDPHNLGACFRTADAAGVLAIVAPKDKAVGITPVVAKVASGAIETVPFIPVTNLVRTLESLKTLGLWIYGTDETAQQSLYQTDLTTPAALVLGAEGKGLRRLTREHCDVLVSIPMLGAVQSLNVSVATGVCLYEVLRQRLAKSV